MKIIRFYVTDHNNRYVAQQCLTYGTMCILARNIQNLRTMPITIKIVI